MQIPRSIDPQRVFDQLPVAVLAVQHGRVLYANHAAHAMLQQPTLVGQPLATLLPELTLEPLQELQQHPVPMLARCTRITVDGYVIVLRYALLDLPSQRSHHLGRLQGRLDHILELHARLLDLPPAWLGEQQREPLRVSNMNARRLARMVAGIQRLGAAVDDTAPPAPLELHALLADELQQLRAQHPAHILLAEPTADQPLPMVSVAQGIRTIVRELVSNACAASEPQQPVLVQVERRGPTVHLSVSDQGHGFSTNPSASGLRPMLTVFGHDYDRAALDGAELGAGVGLAIVGYWVQRLGGWLRAESHAAGTVLYVELPLAPLDAWPDGTSTLELTLPLVLERLPLALLVVDASNHVQWANRAGVIYAGLERNPHSDGKTLDQRWMHDQISPGLAQHDTCALADAEQRVLHIINTAHVLDNRIVGYIVSGDLINPTTPIRGFAYLLLLEACGPLSEQAQALVAAIHTEAVTLRRYIDEVYFLSPFVQQLSSKAMRWYRQRRGLVQADPDLAIRKCTKALQRLAESYLKRRIHMHIDAACCSTALQLEHLPYSALCAYLRSVPESGRVQLWLRVERTSFELRLAHTGPDPDLTHDGHLPLMQLDLFARAFGGTLTVTSTDSGTQLRVWLPAPHW